MRTRSELASAQVRRKRLVAVARAATPGEHTYSADDVSEITQRTAAVSAAAAVAALRASEHDIPSEPPAAKRFTQLSKHGKVIVAAVGAVGTAAALIGKLLGLFSSK